MTGRQSVRNGKNKFGSKGALMALTAICASVSIIPAFAAKIDGGNNWKQSSILSDGYTPAGVDVRLAARLQELNKGKAVKNNLFPYTPAGLSIKDNGSLTVAARSLGRDYNQKGAVSVRSAITEVGSGNELARQFARTNFRLTAMKGATSFSAITPPLSLQKRPAALLESTTFKLDGDKNQKPSRFGSDVSLIQPRTNATSPSGHDDKTDYGVSLGGKYRLAKGVDLTAGVRYKSERDSTVWTDPKADSEAVYVGTRIKF
ncbi:hypothetical protein [Sphingorhabdus lutea]|nr:hypothetical protein [Sphingorhabdus lutea]